MSVSSDLSLHLHGRSGIVAGGARPGGMSQRTAQILAMAGASVTLVDRDTRVGDTVADIRAIGGHALPVVADLAVEAEAARAVEEHITAFGRCDFVINVAGGSGPQLPVLLSKTTQADLEGAFRSNVSVPHNPTHAATPFLRAVDGDKLVVFVGSVNGQRGFGALAEGAYAAAKAALDGYVSTFAAENREFGIRAIKLDPASMPNPHSPTWSERLNDPRTLEQLKEMYPLGWLAPDDFAGVVLFLLSRWARLINAISIPIDGGMSGCGLRPFRPDGRWYMPMPMVPQDPAPNSRHQVQITRTGKGEAQKTE